MAELLDYMLTPLVNDQNVLMTDCVRLQNELVKLASLSGASICPTCNQEIRDVEAHRLELAARLEIKNDEQQRIRARIVGLDVQRKQLEVVLQNKRKSFNVVLDLEKEASTYTVTDVDPAVLENIKLRRLEYAEAQQQLSSLREKLTGLEGSLNLVNEKITNLTLYTGNSSPTEELNIMLDVLRVHQSRKDELEQLNHSITQLQMELQLLTQRLTTHRINREKNQRRADYLNKLRVIYDLLHTSQFPRRLIETYSAVVESELQNQLQHFSLPYSVKIGEGFEIITTNSEGCVIPRLSGGEQSVMGVCLRLALHSLFSQSFPMLMIDEGTTNMDEKNRGLYFQCIKSLKDEQIIKQVIVIDHDPALRDVVDQTIQL